MKLGWKDVGAACESAQELAVEFQGGKAPLHDTEPGTVLQEPSGLPMLWRHLPHL